VSPYISLTVQGVSDGSAEAQWALGPTTSLGRRVLTLYRHEAGLRQQLAVYQGYHNFCLPHAALQLPLPQPAPPNETGSTKRGRPCTPAMAGGLTDHVWTLREVLLFRVPPWPQP
jgi:hypothetical protein